MDELKETILSKGFFGRSNCSIVGSYIYKHLLRGESVEDIDCICRNVTSMSGKLKRKYEAAYSQPSTYHSGDVKMKVPVNSKDVNIDIIQRDSFMVWGYGREPSFINSLVLTSNGIEHIKGDEKKQKYIEENLRQGRYCPWSNMRKKDKAYFKDLEEIPSNECKKHGFEVSMEFLDYLKIVK